MAEELVLGAGMDAATVSAMTIDEVRMWFSAAKRREERTRPKGVG